MMLCQIDQSTSTRNEPLVPGKNEINFRGALLDKQDVFLFFYILRFVKSVVIV
jgi:hypothetical protein